jgi:hypothetical protein
MRTITQWFWRRVDDVTYNWNCDRPRFWAKITLGLGVLSTGLILQFGDPFTFRETPVEVNAPQQAWVQLAWLVISVGLSYLAGQMLAKKSDSPIQSDKPTTLAIRGSFTSWHVGIRRVGPVFCWAGDREIRKESAGGGGKGGGDDPEVDVYYEAGWHVLGMGPMYALHSIIQGGVTIFKGPITAESHPSGTSVDLGSEGVFTIYWGEPTQPTNTFLGNANRVSITSRWPHACYVVWNKKRLSGQTWAIVDYEMERRPSWTGLSLSQSWYEPGRTLTGGSDTVTAVLASSVETTGYLEVEGDRTSRYKPSFDIELTGVGTMPDGTYEILKSEINKTQIGAPPWFSYTTQTRIFLQDGTLGADAVTASVQVWEDDETDGANIAHVMGELLFADWPLGLQLDPLHIVEGWDLDSLEELGQEAETNLWRAAVMGTQGETAEAMLGSMLQDHGTMLPIDTSSGKMLFQRIRFPSGAILAFVDDIYAERLPEIETLHGEQPVDRLIFSFTDRENQYGDMTITVDEDGQASFSEHSRARKVPLVSTTVFATAASLAELRSPEELAPGASFRLDASREARDLLPGQAITAEGFDEVLRVIEVSIDPDTERVELKVIPDFYGVPLSDFVTGGGGIAPPPEDPAMDEAFTWVEIPEQLLGTNFPATQYVMVPRIRANANISFSTIHISDDDVTYTVKTNDLNVQTGGTLLTALEADGPTFEAQSVDFTELGPDNAATADYSADLTSWGLGRQLAVIVSSNGTEICFLQKTTITGGSTRRLDGLLRARYDTRKLAHPIGSVVYVIDSAAITEITDGLLEPTLPLWVKSQPGTTGGQVNLSAVTQVGNALVGKGQVPIAPDYVHVKAPYPTVPAYETTDDITVGWAISTGIKSTGAGGQSSGVAVGLAVIPGTVQIEFLTVGNVVKRTVSVDPSLVESYTYLNATLVADFGSEQDIHVRCTHIANGFSSPVSPTLFIDFI